MKKKLVVVYEIETDDYLDLMESEGLTLEEAVGQLMDDELGAARAREMRAKGAMLDAIKEIEKLEKQLQQATGCLALYLEAEDMIAKQSCDKGTVKFLRSLE